MGRQPNWWLPEAPPAPPPYDLARVAREGGLTCPHGWMRCEALACIDFGCVAVETPDGQQTLDV